MRKWLTIVLVTFLFAPLAGRASNNKPFYRDNPYFGGPYGFDVNEVREFFNSMQLAVKKNDINWLTNHLAYPLKVRHSGRSLIIRDAVNFRRNYRKIVDDVVKEAVTCQKFNNLFVNSEGIMVGYGAIWFSRIYIGKNQAHIENLRDHAVSPVSTTEAGEIRASMSNKSLWAYRIIAIDDGKSVQDFLKRDCKNCQ